MGMSRKELVLFLGGGFQFSALPASSIEEEGGLLDKWKPKSLATWSIVLPTRYGVLLEDDTAPKHR